ncbi:MAG: hypothetical protein AAGD43_27320 [Pseudomonadota bacterium]
MHSVLKRMYRSGVIVACGLFLSGCAGYDVELKGGVFDYLGVSNIGKKKAEPQMAQRTGIVVPPRTAALPVPGSRPAPQQVASADGQQWPVNPEDAKAAKAKAILDQHLAFCAKEKQKVDTGIVSAPADGPLGSCEESVLKNLTGKRVFDRKAEQPAQ